MRTLRSIEAVVVYDPNPSTFKFLRSQHPELSVTAVASPQAVAAASDMLVLATWATEPLLSLSDVSSDHHLTSLGVDEPGKVEIADDLLRASTLVVDDRSLAKTSGVLAQPWLVSDSVELGDVLRDPGWSTSRTGVTVYSPVGLPWQDLAFAWPIVQRCLAEKKGYAINFLE